MSMKTTTLFLILAALFAPTANQAQQSPSLSTPPPQAQTHPAPCVPPTPTPAKPNNGFHANVPTWLQKAIDKRRQQLQNQTGISTPSSDDVKKQMQQAAAPCPSVTAPAPKPVPAPAPNTTTQPTTKQ